jgi:hypothetical protein
VVADGDLDHGVLDARVDVDDDRAGSAGVDDGVRERLARRQEDVCDLLVVGVLRDEPEPELGAKERRLALPCRQAKAEPVLLVSGCRGYVDGNPPGSRCAAVGLCLSAGNRSRLTRASLDRVIRRRTDPTPLFE